MKKILMLILVLVLLLSSCSNDSKELAETQQQPLDTETIAPSDSFNEIYSATPIPLTVYSIDDLVSEIEAIKNGKGSASIDVSSLNELIVPDIEIEGYKLWVAMADKFYFQYCYIPISTKIENNMQIDYDNHIVIYIARPEYVPNKEDPLQGLVGQEADILTRKVIYTSAICGILPSPMSRLGRPYAIRQRSHTMKPSNIAS